MRKNKYDELEVDENQFEAEIMITKENFYNNDWGVYRFETSTPLPKIEPEEIIGGQPKYCATLAGNVQRLDIGQVYNATLTLDFNNKFKQWQFKPIIVNPCVPTSVASQQKFLCSILTVKQAQTLLDVYPNIVQDVIDGKVDIDFSKLKGITANNWDSIRNKIIDNFVIADVLALLSPLGVTYAMIKKLVEFEGNPHLLKQKLKENPYLLTQVKGLGFKKVDKLALQLNPEFLKSKMRGIAYIKYYLEEVGNDEGHTWIQNRLLKENYINNVPECVEYYDEIIKQEYRNSMFLKVNEDLSEIGLRKNYDYEEYIAYKLAENNKYGIKHISEDIIQRGIDRANEFQGFEYDEEQVKTIYDIVNGSGVQILTGLGGTGKSSISRGILNVFQEAGMTINTCALSARASIVVRESTGFQSSTIHRLLGYGFGGFFYNQNNNLITDVLMLDEASMVNISLFKSLVEAVPTTTKILIVGDGGQLPSIGCGNILNDLVDMNDSRICTINFLKKIYRQAMKSAIITDANMIRENKNPIQYFKNKIVHGELKDMFYMFFDNKDDVYKNALNLYYRSIESSGVDNVVITCPRRENALNSARTFNVDIQEHLLGEVKEQIKYGDLVYKKGCKIMQIENNYEKDIFNGEIGYIIECNEKSIVAKFDQREIKYNKSELNQIDYAYAITIFKLQGGMCKNVIGVLDKSHFIMLNSSLLYTMITRASKKCCIFAEPFAFKTAVETSAIINRHTYLPLMNVDKESNCLTRYKKVNIEKENIVLPESDELLEF